MSTITEYGTTTNPTPILSAKADLKFEISDVENLEKCHLLAKNDNIWETPYFRAKLGTMPESGTTVYSMPKPTTDSSSAWPKTYIGAVWKSVTLFDRYRQFHLTMHSQVEVKEVNLQKYKKPREFGCHAPSMTLKFNSIMI
ncbi:hypothetical protein Ddc_06914 [Ditylenchus destructor]|nr:hypothetical protein Ddc_06914 [Ditylenchus destructor]